MKKVILGAAALLMTIGVVAQVQPKPRDARGNQTPAEEEAHRYYSPTEVDPLRNEVFVNQISLPEEEGNTVRVSQKGEGNFSSNYQRGGGNLIDVTQGNEAVKGTGNVSLVEIRGNGYSQGLEAQRNTVLVRQFDKPNPNSVRGENIVTVDVAGEDNRVDVRQKGARNNINESGLFEVDGKMPEIDIDGPGFQTVRNALSFNDIIDVRGNFNVANLTQEGNKNQANIKIAGRTELDSEGNPEGRTKSTILQGGNKNTAWSYQAGLEEADDPSNIADTYYGKGNTSTIKQGVDFTNDFDFDKFVFTDEEKAWRNYAGVEQYGEFNNNLMEQTGYDNLALVKQVGDNNRSDIDQDQPNDDKGNDAYVDQTGSYNWADVDQSGTNNIADVDQTSDKGQWSNQSTSTQMGDNNSLVVMQLDDDTSFITQDGSSNYANVYQDGANTSTINQNGTGNIEGNYAEVDQRTDGVASTNKSTINQQNDSRHNYAGVFQMGDNKSTINQYNGEKNYAMVTQTGANTSTMTQQNGDWNDAFLVQDGTGNNSTLMQDGNNNLFNGTQNGTNNVIDVTQLGGATYNPSAGN